MYANFVVKRKDFILPMKPTWTVSLLNAYILSLGYFRKVYHKTNFTKKDPEEKKKS